MAWGIKKNSEPKLSDQVKLKHMGKAFFKLAPEKVNVAYFLF